MSTFAKALTYYLAVKGKTLQDLNNDLLYSFSMVYWKEHSQNGQD